MRMIDLTWNFKEKNGRCKQLYLYSKNIFAAYWLYK